MLVVSAFLPTLFVFPVFTDSMTNLFFFSKNNLTYQNYIDGNQYEKSTQVRLIYLLSMFIINAQLSHVLSTLFLTWLQRSKWGSRYQGLKKWK
ncbi:hypothetical protein C2S36_06845 [Helicobacter pylori]|nr:hypothetical protein C2S36_06845 [Helicobacter pylori]